jgi:2-aminoethylphosphonate-pyruvate transaminase
MEVTMHDDENPYLLLTPGPLSTSPGVRRAMLRDWCTWDADYNEGVVQVIRARLVQLATTAPGYTSVLMQGSGTFAVEAALGTFLPADGRLLVLANGAYGRRLAQIAARLRIPHQVQDEGDLAPTNLERLDATLAADPGLTHVALVHGETTTGMLNPLAGAAEIVRRHGRILIVDAMSTFGGVPMDLAKLGVDVLVSSANKCLQGVPGFGFVLAREELLAACAGRARSLALDLYDQWREMERGHGKWRYTSPTHVVRAFAQALTELDEEGGIAARHARYVENHRRLVEGFVGLGLRPLLPREWMSPIITSFHYPEQAGWTFEAFYARLKARGFVLYPGKISEADCFRVGTIGHVFPADFDRLVAAVRDSEYSANG